MKLTVTVSSMFLLSQAGLFLGLDIQNKCNQVSEVGLSVSAERSTCPIVSWREEVMQWREQVIAELCFSTGEQSQGEHRYECR